MTCPLDRADAGCYKAKSLRTRDTRDTCLGALGVAGAG